MGRFRFTLASLLGAVVLLGLVFAGLRSGSNDWFKSIYTLTFITLAYAAIAARYRGPFWYGFAVVGWAYFVVGFGPWIGEPAGRKGNRDLGSSLVADFVAPMLAARDPMPPGMPLAVVGMHQEMRMRNRSGICHAALTVVFAIAGGFAARRVAAQPA